MKSIITAFTLSIFLYGCAHTTPLDKYQKEIDAYGNVTWDGNKITVPLPEFWFKMAEIAKRNNRPAEAELFMMLHLEASKMERGDANQYVALADRYIAGDAELFNDAERYFINISAQKNCLSFGYAARSSDYNKCVFDVSQKILDRKIQAELMMLQLMNSTRLPPVSLPTQTKCTTSGNQTSCISQ